jgi:hypothetical protein
MKKYSVVFTHLVWILCCVMWMTNTAWAATAQKKRRPIRIPPYQASVMVHNHGMISDLMVAARDQRQSLWYGSTQIQPLYTSWGSLMSLGGGYRRIVNPLWVIGGHVHIEGGRLPHNLGYYAKLNPGIEAHTMRVNFSANVYLPIVMGGFNRLIEAGKLERHDYIGHQARSVRYVDQNQFSFDLQGGLNIRPSLGGCLGFYGARQKNNPHIWGVMMGLEYTWNQYFSIKLKGNVDTFHGHYITFGPQIQRPYSTPSKPIRLQQALWRPLAGHAAPLQMRDNHLPIKEAHHLFFDSQVDQSARSDGSYESPYHQISNGLLQSLRTKYPPHTQKVLYHLRGTFALGGEDLKLAAYEGIKGEKPKQVEETKFKILEFLKIKLDPKDLYQDPIPEKTLQKIHPELIKLVEYERLFEGLPIIRGSISLNSHTSLSEIGGLLPNSVRTAVSLRSLDKETSIDTRMAAVMVSKKEDITIDDVAIYGDPSSNQYYQYSAGIDISDCAALCLKSIWINHALTGLYLQDVQQASEDSIQALYIGSPHLSVDVKRMKQMKNDLSTMVQMEREERVSEAYQLHQQMINWLSCRTLNLRELLQYEASIDITRLPTTSISVTELDVESRVFMGIHAQNSASDYKPKSTIDKLKNTLMRQKTHEPQPLKTIPLNVSDSVLMTQGPAWAVENGLPTFSRCVLGSKLLGGYIKDTDLTLIGNLGKTSSHKTTHRIQDSFLYINGVTPLPKIPQAVDSVPFLRDLRKSYWQQLPDAIYLEETQKAPQKTNVKRVNTPVVMVVQDTHWRLGSDKGRKRDVYLCKDMDAPHLMDDNGFSLIHPGRNPLLRSKEPARKNDILKEKEIPKALEKNNDTSQKPAYAAPAPKAIPPKGIFQAAQQHKRNKSSVRTFGSGQGLQPLALQNNPTSSVPVVPVKIEPGQAPPTRPLEPLNPTLVVPNTRRPMHKGQQRFPIKTAKTESTQSIKPKATIGVNDRITRRPSRPSSSRGGKSPKIGSSPMIYSPVPFLYSPSVYSNEINPSSPMLRKPLSAFTFSSSQKPIDTLPIPAMPVDNLSTHGSIGASKVSSSVGINPVTPNSDANSAFAVNRPEKTPITLSIDVPSDEKIAAMLGRMQPKRGGGIRDLSVEDQKIWRAIQKQGPRRTVRVPRTPVATTRPGLSLPSRSRPGTPGGVDGVEPMPGKL